MSRSSAVLKALRVRAVLVPFRRPFIAGIGRFDEWPLVLVDLETNGGIVGRRRLG
jgi:mandelate racemase